MAEKLDAPRAPLPPPRRNEVVVLGDDEVVWRVYRSMPYDTDWNTFRRHGPTTSRFDHHRISPDPARAILYGAEDPTTSLAEVFQQSKVIDRFKDGPHLAAFSFQRELRLLDLMGTWITRAGGNMAIHSGARQTARDWSNAIYDAFPDLDGLVYASSMHANKRCFAIYERAANDIAHAPRFHHPLSHPEVATLLSEASFNLDYDIV